MLNTSKAGQWFMRTSLCLLAAMASCLIWLGASHAQAAYPTRTITIVVPFPAGSATDVLARILAKGIEEGHGQTVVVENKPGGVGNPGTEYVVKSKPDGYTLLVTGIPSAANQALYQNLTYDTQKDLVAVSQLATFPLLLVVHNSTGVTSVEELIKVAKERKLNAGSSGVGSSQQLAAMLFESMAGVRFQHVYYQGSSAIVSDLIAGLVELTFGDMVSVTAALQEGTVSPIAVTSLKRSAKFPDLPTVDEAGVAGFTATGWYGLFAPKDTPAEIVELLGATAGKVLQDPAVVERVTAMGGEPLGSAPAEFTAFVNDEIAKWKRVATELGFEKIQ